MSVIGILWCAVRRLQQNIHLSRVFFFRGCSGNRERERELCIWGRLKDKTIILVERETSAIIN